MRRSEGLTNPDVLAVLSRPMGDRGRLLLEHNLVGMYRTTLDGRILDCNESMAAMMGYRSRKELLGRPASDLYFGIPDRAAFLVRLRERNFLTNFELCLRRRDGTPVYILENVVLLPDERGRRRIIQGTMVDITDRKRAEEALRESEQRYKALAEELRRLMHRVQAVREEQRGQIARELHDELGQALTALNMDLHWLKGRAGGEPRTVQGRIESMRKLVNKTIHSVRRICAELRPALLDDQGLAAAIEWQARQFQLRTGIRCRVSVPAVTPRLHRDQTTDVFRIFQESLTNIARHARASRAAVTLRTDAGGLLLKVSDNGVGIRESQARNPHSLGLVGLRERAMAWGGDVQINGAPRKGTTVMLRMPVSHGSPGPKP